MRYDTEVAGARMLWGDCLERMKEIPDGSVSMVLTDIPYDAVNRDSNGLRELDKGIGREGSGQEDLRGGDQGVRQGCNGSNDSRTSERPANPTNGFWRDADWLFCRDGKWRPAQRGLKPLVNGTPSEMVSSCDLGIQDVEDTKEARAMRLKGYGNAIVAPVATAFIETVMEYLETP